MALTVNEMIKQVAIDVGLEEPTGTLYSSTDKDIKLIHQFLLKTGRALRAKYLFPQLKKTYSFSTSASDAQYVFPGDYFRMIGDTTWDQTDNWQIAGPLTDATKNAFLHGIISSAGRRRFYVFGSDYTSGQFFLNPTPTATHTVSFDYIRSQWFVPKEWTAGESVTSGTTYRFSSGNIYLAGTTASTGATPPSHTTGSASDGTVSWTYVSTQLYGSNGRFQADTDIPLIDDELLMLGATWRYLKRKGLDYGEEKLEYETEANARCQRMPGATILNMGSDGYTTLLSQDNIPDGDFG